MDSDKPRGDDVQVLGRNMGALPAVHEQRALEIEQPRGNTINIIMPAEIAGALERMASIQRDRSQIYATIEGDVVE